MSVPIELQRAARPGGLALVFVRWLLGGFFVYAGVSKALQPVGFLQLVHQYDFAAHPVLLNGIAALLPWLEVFCGVLLVAGVAVRGTALLLAGLLVPFTILILRRALAIHGAGEIPFCAIRFDCGCGLGETLICRKLAENVVMILLAGVLVFRSGSRWCARYSLTGK